MGFIKGCRPFLGLDGCHLKGKHKGITLSATSIDANNCLFPVAFAIVKSECGDSWKWFMENLYSSIGEIRGLAFMSDKDKGLEAAIPLMFPSAEHKTCVRHLYQNFKKKYPGELFERLIWNCANSYNTPSFQWHLREIKSASSNAATYLEGLTAQAWSRSQFTPNARIGYVTNNISKSFNAWINKTRQMPIVEMVETIRHKIMERIDHRRALGRKWRGKLVPKALKYVQTIVKDIGEYIVRRSSDVMAEVAGPDFTIVVRLDERTCTCRAWQVTGLPCIHAAAFITRIRGLDICDFVDEVYSLQKFRDTYASSIAPMPSKGFRSISILFNDPQSFPTALLKKPNTVVPFSSAATSNTGSKRGNSANRPQPPPIGKPNKGSGPQHNSSNEGDNKNTADEKVNNNGKN
ncbi:hypothetical protein QJS04_geneDACA014618 [Acorus gramineus]|uniref:SWIM-type domain-containing protein n=1 Tax=Acorus gramineus TaxID=55184 RepID=A0AAV9ARJ4_ACOGR|nr:hypothetical protein QJS04_geneDACA014618 [Acorus gramineus]